MFRVVHVSMWDYRASLASLLERGRNLNAAFGNRRTFKSMTTRPVIAERLIVGSGTFKGSYWAYSAEL